MDLFRIAHQSLIRAEEIVKSQFNPANEGVKQLQQRSDVLSDGQGKSTIDYIVPDDIPRIPVSPLAKLRSQQVQAFAVSQARYAAALKLEQAPPLSAMRRLVEDVQMAQSKLQEIDAIYVSIAQASWTRFAPEAIAVSIARIDVSLFAGIVARTDLIPHALSAGIATSFSADSILSSNVAGNGNPASGLPSPAAAIKQHQPTTMVASVQALIDFHDYLTHVAINGILSASHPSSAIHALVYTSYLLLYVYRDLSATVSIIRALNSVMIRRLRASCWDHVHPKAKEVLKALTHQAAPSSNHLDLTRQVLYHHFKGGGMMCCIPWLDPFLDSIRHIHVSYTVNVADSTPYNGLLSTSGGLVLSDIGARMLEDEVLRPIEMCMGFNKWDKDRDTITSTNASIDAGPIDINGIPIEGNGVTSIKRTSMLVKDDLTALGKPDNSVAHWLLTRVYCDFGTLFEQSCSLEALGRGEIVSEFSLGRKRPVTGRKDVVAAAVKTPPDSSVDNAAATLKTPTKSYNEIQPSQASYTPQSTSTNSPSQASKSILSKSNVNNDSIKPLVIQPHPSSEDESQTTLLDNSTDDEKDSASIYLGSDVSQTSHSQTPTQTPYMHFPPAPAPSPDSVFINSHNISLPTHDAPQPETLYRHLAQIRSSYQNYSPGQSPERSLFSSAVGGTGWSSATTSRSTSVEASPTNRASRGPMDPSSLLGNNDCNRNDEGLRNGALPPLAPELPSNDDSRDQSANAAVEESSKEIASVGDRQNRGILHKEQDEASSSQDVPADDENESSTSRSPAMDGEEMDKALLERLRGLRT